MFGSRWRLFNLFGIPISVDVSWLIVLVLLTGSMADLFRQRVAGLEGVVSYLFGFGAALLFFVCIVLHEMGHALTARATGTPIRGITLFIFGGVAELGDEPRTAGNEFLVAVAGPIVSAILAALLLGLYAVGTPAGLPAAALVLFETLGWINLSLLLFNLVPAFPLDGGRVLRAALWGLFGNLRRATWWASLAGRAFAFVLIAIGVLNLFAGNVLSGIWLGLIGLFLNNAARGSYQSVLVREALSGEPVRRFMNDRPIVVPPETDLRQWVEDYVYRYHRKAFPVGVDGRLDGYVTTKVLSDVPREEWAARTVEEVMARDLEAVSIGPDAEAVDALAQMQRGDVSRLLVVDGGRLLGIVSLKDLLRFLQMQIELEGEGEGAPRPTREVVLPPRVRPPAERVSSER